MSQSPRNRPLLEGVRYREVFVRGGFTVYDSMNRTRCYTQCTRRIVCKTKVKWDVRRTVSGASFRVFITRVLNVLFSDVCDVRDDVWQSYF